MASDEKPMQQKLRKIHPNLENQIKSELNKLPDELTRLTCDFL